MIKGLQVWHLFVSAASQYNRLPKRNGRSLWNWLAKIDLYSKGNTFRKPDFSFPITVDRFIITFHAGSILPIPVIIDNLPSSFRLFAVSILVDLLHAKRAKKFAKNIWGFYA